MLAVHKGTIPMFRLVLPLLIGIALGLSYSWLAYLPQCRMLIVALGCLLLGLNIFYRQLGVYRFSTWLGILIHSILLLFGITYTERSKEINDSRHFSHYPADFLLVKVSTDPVRKGAHTRAVAHVVYAVHRQAYKPVLGQLMLAWKSNQEQLARISYGDRMLIKARYKTVDPPRNPGAFNFKKYLQLKNIYFTSFLGSHQFLIIDHDKGNYLIAYALRLRRHLLGQFEKHIPHQEARAVAATLTLGDRSDLSKELMESYAKTGTIHVLAVSGMHVGLIYLMINLLLQFLMPIKYGKYFKAVLCILFIWQYALITGLSASVTRAAFMLSLMIIGKTYNKSINTFNILSCAAFVLLLYHPFYLADVGFQLSYLAVCGLICLQPIIMSLVPVDGKIKGKIWAYSSVCIAAQILTFPLSMYYFHRFPVYFLISNLLVVIPITGIMYVGILLLILPEVKYLSDWLGTGLDRTILLLNDTLNFIEHLPIANWDKIWLSPLSCLLMYTVIFLTLCWLHYKKNIFFTYALVALLLLCCDVSYRKYHADARASIAFLNLKGQVGIVFKDGQKGIIVSDLEQDNKVYQFFVQPFLDSSRVVKATLLNLSSGYQTVFFKKQGAIMQFYNKTLLLLDSCRSYQALTTKLDIDYLYLPGNKNIHLQQLIDNYSFKWLVIDAKYSDALVAQWNRYIAGKKDLKKVEIVKNDFALSIAVPRN